VGVVLFSVFFLQPFDNFRSGFLYLPRLLRVFLAVHFKILTDSRNRNPCTEFNPTPCGFRRRLSCGFQKATQPPTHPFEVITSTPCQNRCSLLTKQKHVAFADLFFPSSFENHFLFFNDLVYFLGGNFLGFPLVSPFCLMSLCVRQFFWRFSVVFWLG